MATQDEEIYDNLDICHICKEKSDTDKIKDYSTISGKFRGAAHNQFSLKLKIPKMLPFIFHNLEGYDRHIIFKELNNVNVDIEVIPKTIEKYMSIIVNRNITFVDPNEFYKGSLDTIASNLEDNDFKHYAYPYVWVDSYEKFKYLSLPPKECFFSSLRDGKSDKCDGHISDKQYLHLRNVWDTFSFNIFEDFHNHHLKKDVLLLADSFKKFISTCLKYYDLDLSHYFSALGLSRDAMLKMTKVELEKICDPNQYIFIEKGIRGGISYINKRYSKASNEYCSVCISKKVKTYITYLDMNNLYGCAKSQYLAYANLNGLKI